MSRRVTPKPPRAWRLIPLVAGLAELTYFIGRRPDTTNGQLAAYLSGFLLILTGLLLAGPWLTMIGARVLAGRASRAATLIAGRRLADNPQAGFRSVGGLIVALFVASVATGTITTFVANRGEPRTDSLAATSLAKRFFPDDGPAPAAEQIPTGLATIPGVRSVTLVRLNPDASGSGGWPGVITCAELDRLTVFGSCPSGAQVASVYPDLIGPRTFDQTSDPYVWETAGIAPTEVDRQPILSVVVDTTSRSAFEQARTMLVNAFPSGRFPASIGEWEADSAQQMVQFQQLANVVMLASLPIAGCSLAVSIAGGLRTGSGRSACCGLPGCSCARCAGGRAGDRRAAADRLRGGDRDGVPGRAALPAGAVALHAGAAGPVVLPRGRGWAGGVAGNHRLDVAAAGPDHRPGDGPERVSHAPEGSMPPRTGARPAT